MEKISQDKFNHNNIIYLFDASSNTASGCKSSNYQKILKSWKKFWTFHSLTAVTKGLILLKTGSNFL